MTREVVDEISPLVDYPHLLLKKYYVFSIHTNYFFLFIIWFILQLFYFCFNFSYADNDTELAVVCLSDTMVYSVLYMRYNEVY